MLKYFFLLTENIELKVLFINLILYPNQLSFLKTARKIEVLFHFSTFFTNYFICVSFLFLSSLHRFMGSGHRLS